MEKQNNFTDEIKVIAPSLSEVDKAMPYWISADHFEQLSNNILFAVKLDSVKNNSLPYAVPTNYFENLSSAILSKTILEDKCNSISVYDELVNIAPVLNTIGKQTIYSVPLGYFDGINPLHTQHIQTKIITLFNSKKWLKYAIAACLTGILVTGTFMFNNKKGGVDYAAYKKIDVPNSINKLSNDELINYLDNVNSITNANYATTLDYKLPEIQDHIQSISDEELNQYLQEANISLEQSDNKNGI